MEPSTLLGFLLTLSNIEKFGGPNWQLKDFSVKVDTYAKLKEHIIEHPGFSVEDFRKHGFHRVENLAIYVPTYVREHMFGGNTDPNESGVLIFFHFEPRTSFEAFKSKDKETSHFLVRLDGLSEDEARYVLRQVENGKL